MELKIKTDQKKYFRQLLEVLAFAPKFCELSQRERDLFAEILRVNWSYKTLSKEDRWTLITSSDSREKMRLVIGVSKEGLNNLYTSLRRKGFVTFSGIVDDYMLTPATTLTIKFYSDAD